MEITFTFSVQVMILCHLSAVTWSSCPKDWSSFGGKCYHLTADTDTSWQGSKTKCETLGASMVKISSKTESDFLFSMIPSLLGIWIGAKYDTVSNAYVWTDGSGVDYSLTALPAGSSDTCVMMIQVPNMQTWNTQTCTTNLKVLCEKDDAGGADNKTSEKSEYWTMIRDSEYVNENRLSSSNCSDKILCAAQCNRQEKCNVFSFGSEVCYLHNVVDVSAMQTLPSSGWKVYHNVP